MQENYESDLYVWSSGSASFAVHEFFRKSLIALWGYAYIISIYSQKRKSNKEVLIDIIHGSMYAEKFDS